MSFKNLLLITLLVVLVVLINRIAEEGVKRVDKRLTAKPAPQQDYYLSDFSITALDNNGEPRHRLEAAQLSHFSGGEQTTLQKPRVEVYQQGEVEWLTSAEQGVIDMQRDEVQLTGGVTLDYESKRTPPLRLTTQTLNIYPTKGRAETDQAITLIQGSSHIKAIGMRLEQRGPRLQLLSQVRGHYEIPAP